MKETRLQFNERIKGNIRRIANIIEMITVAGHDGKEHRIVSKYNSIDTAKRFGYEFALHKRMVQREAFNDDENLRLVAYIAYGGYIAEHRTASEKLITEVSAPFGSEGRFIDDIAEMLDAIYPGNAIKEQIGLLMMVDQ